MADSPGSDDAPAQALSEPLPPTAWPPPLAHCSQPLAQSTDEWITVAEITSEPANGYKGNRLLYTALVPKAGVSAVLSSVGGIHNNVSLAGFKRVFGQDGECSPQFWINGSNGEKYETLVHTWDNHRQLILLPDDGFLMAYQLAPRVLADGTMAWDDLDRPVYDVVRVSPVSNYRGPDGYTTARISIRRDYLEDYLSRKDCVAVATYFDERYSLDEPEVEKLIQHKTFSVRQPGREFWFKRMKIDFANQISQVSACTTLMKPKSEPISNPVEADLKWPDRSDPVKGHGKGRFAPMELAYVQDAVLREYEQRPEYDINPEHGSVSYETRWSVGYVRRRGRNHLEIELRKLYEGAPYEVIKRFHSFAVASAVAAGDRNVHGDRNIGLRAKELVYAYLEFTATLAAISEHLGLVASQEDIGQFDSDKVKYQGWWTLPEFKSLGHVSLETMPFPDLLDRAKDIFNLLQRLQKSPLLQMAVNLGLKKDEVKGLQSLRLAGTICQLARLAVDSGLDLIQDKASIATQWDATVELDPLRPLFKLNGLRIADAHSLTGSMSQEMIETLKVFGIDHQQYVSGWGGALDKIFDTLIASLTAMKQLLMDSLPETL